MFAEAQTKEFKSVKKAPAKKAAAKKTTAKKTTTKKVTSKTLPHYPDMTVAELKKIAKMHNVTGYSKMKKADLVKKLQKLNF
jgi:hypothetical protein